MARSVQKYNTLEMLITFKLAIYFSEYLDITYNHFFKILKRCNLTIYLPGMLVMAAMMRLIYLVPAAKLCSSVFYKDLLSYLLLF